LTYAFPTNFQPLLKLRQSVFINRSGHWDQQAWPLAKVIPEQEMVTVWGNNIIYKKKRNTNTKITMNTWQVS